MTDDQTRPTDTTLPHVVLSSLRASVRIRRYVEPILTRRRVTWSDIVGRAKDRKLRVARIEVYVALRDAGYSLPQIGRWCCRDHTTISHHLLRIGYVQTVKTKPQEQAQ